ncbi:hypothetical protein CHU92_06995 [Flavobacterium cyanobacteriorum]|uniref:Outer membrane protein beta-barrel domain-containing protein n=1 Tax=Flavobacterium cyanobacteriorum TaxID=2022802 RepID=A0A255ZBL7_9FLAO|nr:OmpW family outer membrane protein [Flavobacterium cyanobacteriorum]OYQ38000.1 hypothetical protein CHU92_06995 [Flavobacterium cyanobacteriorum]
MKKIILSAAALFAFAFVNAQEAETPAFGFKQGDVLLEGNLSFGFSKDEDDAGEVKESTFNFNPKAGYFLTEKLALGVEFGVGSEKTEDTPNGGTTAETTTNSFNAGVFARYYFLDLGQRFKTYAEAGVGYGSSKDEEDGQEVSKLTGFNVGIDLGINYFITENFAINFGLTNVLAFNNEKTEFPSGAETKTNSFEGNFNVFNNFFDTAQFGLTWKF